MELTPRCVIPAPSQLHDLRPTELAGVASTTIHPHGSYEALAFTVNDLTGVGLSGTDFGDCSSTALNTLPDQGFSRPRRPLPYRWDMDLVSMFPGAAIASVFWIAVSPSRRRVEASHRAEEK